MATGRLLSPDLVSLWLLLLAASPRQTLSQDERSVKHKSERSSGNNPGQTVSAFRFAHEQTVNPRPDIPHSLFSQNPGRLSGEAESLKSSSVPPQEAPSGSDTETGRRGTTRTNKQTGLDVGGNDDTFTARMIRDTAAFRGRRVSAGALQPTRRRSKPRYDLRQGRELSPPVLAGTGRPVLQGNRRSRILKSRGERLARLRLIWQRYRKKRPSRVVSTQSQTYRSLVSTTRGPADASPTSDAIGQSEGLPGYSSSQDSTPGQSTHHQAATTPSGQPAMPTKLIPEMKVRITSEMTTLSPFIEPSRALDYLNSYSARPVPSRWPLKVVREETERPSPTPPLTRQAAHQHETRKGEPQTKTSLQNIATTATTTATSHMTSKHHLSNSSPLSADTTTKSTTFAAPHVSTGYVNVPQLDWKASTRSWSNSIVNVNSSPAAIAGGSWVRENMGGKNTTPFREMTTGQQSRRNFNGLNETHNVFFSKDRSVRLPLAPQDPRELLTNVEGSGEEQSVEESGTGDLSLVTTTSPWRRRPGRAPRSHQKARRKRKRSGLHGRRSRAERRAARRRRRKQQRLRRRKLKAAKNNRKRGVRKRARPDKQETPGASRSTPLSDKQEAHGISSSTPRSAERERPLAPPFHLSSSSSQTLQKTSYSPLTVTNKFVSVYLHQKLQNTTHLSHNLQNKTHLSHNLQNKTHNLQNKTHLSHNLQYKTHLSHNLQNKTHLSHNLQNKTHNLQNKTHLSHNLQYKNHLSYNLQNKTHLSHNLQNKTHLSHNLQNKTHLSHNLQNKTHLSHYVHNQTNYIRTAVNRSESFTSRTMVSQTVTGSFLNTIALSRGSPNITRNPTLVTSVNVPTGISSSSWAPNTETSHISTNSYPTGVRFQVGRKSSMIPNQINGTFYIDFISSNTTVPSATKSSTTGLESFTAPLVLASQSPALKPDTSKLPQLAEVHLKSSTPTRDRIDRPTLKPDQSSNSNTSSFFSTKPRDNESSTQGREKETILLSSQQQPNTSPATPPRREPQPGEDPPLVGYKTAYDFLSSQTIVRDPHQSEERRRMREYHHAISERLCKVFNKRFVPTSIGGRCV